MKIDKLVRELVDTGCAITKPAVPLADQYMFLDSIKQTKEADPYVTALALDKNLTGTEPDFRTLKKYIENCGLNIYEVPKSEIIYRFQENADGWRIGDRIYVNEKLPDDKKAVVLLHEWKAGHNHIKTDEETQHDVIEYLSRRFPRSQALEIAEQDMAYMKGR